MVPPVVAAGAALLGVRYGAKAAESRESLNWARDQRLKAYAEVLEAVDRCYESFRLINASLSLAEYHVTPGVLTGIQATMNDWGRWDEKISAVLPRAELVASRRLEPLLSYGVKLGMRTRHRALLMQLAVGPLANREEWQSVSGMTVDDQERLRRGLRADLNYRDPVPDTVGRFRARARKWRAHLVRAIRRAPPRPGPAQ